MENIEKILVDLLKDNPAYIKEDKINKEMIFAKLYSYDEALLRKILGNAALKARFFKTLDGLFIFKINEFVDFVGECDLLIKENNLKEGISYNFYEDDANLKNINPTYKDSLLFKMSEDIDYKFKNKFHVSYIPSSNFSKNIRIGDIKLYKEEESFKDTKEITNLKYKAFDLLKEDFEASSSLLTIDKDKVSKLSSYITIFSNPHYYLNMIEVFGIEKTKQVLTSLNDLILKKSDYFENKNMGYHTIIKDSLLREFDGFSLSLLKMANVLNDFGKTDEIFKIFSSINKKSKSDSDLNIIYEFINKSLEELGTLDFNPNYKSKDFYKEYLSCLEYEFRDSLNIFEKLNDFYKILPKKKDNLRAYEEAISYDIDRIVDLLTVKPSDYENLKNAENKLSIGHYTSLDSLGYLIDADMEDVDQIYRNKLRLTNARMLNDPMEGKALFEYLNGSNEDYISLNNYGNNKIYLLSASTMADSLPMWKQYADDTKGVFLEFSKEFIKSIINDKKIKLVKVFYIGEKAFSYNQKSDEINGLLKKLKVDYEAYIEKIVDINKKDSTDKSQLLRTFNNEIFLKLDKISYYFKKDAYAYEGEYRIVVDLDEDESRGHFKEIKFHNPNFPLPFLGTYLIDYELKYQRLIFGPKAIDKDYLVPYIKYCLGKDIETVNSNIKYR